MHDKETVKDRLVAYLNQKGIKQRTFEKSIGVSFGYVTSMRKGLGAEKIELVRQLYPDLNIEWLLTGDGGMLKSKQNRLNSLENPDQGDALMQLINNNTRLTESMQVLIETNRKLSDRILELTDSSKQSIAGTA